MRCTFLAETSHSPTDYHYGQVPRRGLTAHRCGATPGRGKGLPQQKKACTSRNYGSGSGTRSPFRVQPADRVCGLGGAAPTRQWRFMWAVLPESNDPPAHVTAGAPALRCRYPD